MKILAVAAMCLLVCGQSHAQEEEDDIQALCFPPEQIERGVEDVKVQLPSGGQTATMLLTAPIRTDEVDCFSNSFAYPFVREVALHDSVVSSQGIWFGPDGVDAALRNWEKVPLNQARKGDVWVRRSTKGVVEVGSINETGAIAPNRFYIDLLIKPDARPPERYSFEVPANLPVSSEVWRRVR